MDSGSETETDDELFERLELVQQVAVNAPVSPLPDAPSRAPESAVVATNDAVLADEPASETVATPQEDRVCKGKKQTSVAVPVAVEIVSSPHASSARSSGSEDDESPRNQSTTAARQTHRAPPTKSSAHTNVKTVALPSLFIFQPKTLPPVQIGTSTNAAVAAIAKATQQEELASKPPSKVIRQPNRSADPAATARIASGLVTAAPVTTAPVTAAPPGASQPCSYQTPVVVVSSHAAAPVDPVALHIQNLQFTSPFSSLVSQYQPPPPPIVGAPPLLYSGLQTTSAPIPPHHAPTIPCSRCSRVLPENAAPIPLNGHGDCACCGRYFQSLTLQYGQLYCTACAPSAPFDQAASSNSPTLSIACVKCKNTLVQCPPVAGNGVQCQCCFVRYHRSAFSNKQRSLKMRRCKACVAAPPEPQLKTKKTKKPPSQAQHVADQEGMSEKPELRTPECAENSKQKAQVDAAKALPAASATAELRQTATAPAVANEPAPVQAAPVQSSPPPEVSQASPQVRQEMEVEVRKIKLARRSIHRRRKANDWRGSTRLEYEMHLCMEEDSLNQKMISMRRRNPALYDWINQNIEIQGALGIAPSERDHPPKGKKKQKQSNGKKKKRTPPQKRKSSGVAKAALSPAKRARVEPSVPQTPPVKPEIKAEAQ